MKNGLFTKVVLLLAIVAVLAPFSAGQELRGSKTQMPAYYDSKIFTIGFWELPSMGEAMTLLHNGQINFIYQSDQAVEAGFNFISVIDAVPGDGMNPLWNEVQIVFKVGVTPHQFFSDDEILAAVGSEIILIPTTEIYICGVVGKKPKL